MKYNQGIFILQIQHAKHQRDNNEQIKKKCKECFLL